MSEKQRYLAINHLLETANDHIINAFWKSDTEMNVRFVHNCSYLSSGEQLLVKLAASIWNQDTEINLYEVSTKLDAKLYNRFIEALTMLREISKEIREINEIERYMAYSQGSH